MQNLDLSKTKSGKCRLEFDPTVEIGPSSTGKTIIVASTGAAQTVHIDDNGDEVKVMVNVYKKHRGTRLPAKARTVTPAEANMDAAIAKAVAKALANL